MPSDKLFFLFASDAHDACGNGLDSLVGQFPDLERARLEFTRIKEEGITGLDITTAQVATIENGRLVLVEEFFGGRWYRGSEQESKERFRMFGPLETAKRI